MKPSPEDQEFHRLEREARAAHAALSGAVHHFHKTIVIFTHPYKVWGQVQQNKAIAGGDEENYERLMRSCIRAVAFIPTWGKGLWGDRVERLVPYVLPVAWDEIEKVPQVLKRRKELRRASMGDIHWAAGKNPVDDCVPWTTRERLLKSLSGVCPCCGAQSFPNLVEGGAK